MATIVGERNIFDTASVSLDNTQALSLAIHAPNSHGRVHRTRDHNVAVIGEELAGIDALGVALVCVYLLLWQEAGMVEVFLVGWRVDVCAALVVVLLVSSELCGLGRLAPVVSQ